VASGPRNVPQPRPTEALEVWLPSHEFFYTIDQVATLLSVEESWLRKRLYYVGRMPEKLQRDKLQTVNIGDSATAPEWRISHRELTRWLARKGYRIT
jgi:hypothetical protein